MSIQSNIPIRCLKCGTSGVIPATWASRKIKCSQCGESFIVPSPIATAINPIDGAEMVWVPAGEFIMGNDFHEDAGPAHKVSLDGYWMYKYHVTVVQYRAFCAATGHSLPEWPDEIQHTTNITDSKSLIDYDFTNTKCTIEWIRWNDVTGWDDPALQQHPIVNVTWFDAKAYADWARVQLPSEAQWEYVSRGPQGRNYPWGGTATASDPYNGWDNTKCANFFNSYAAGKSTWPVGSFPADTSWCGAMDMAGNAWQWCHDLYGDYPSTPVTNPTGPSTGENHVLRGGDWYFHYEGYYRGSYRNIGASSDCCGFSIGFRCASSMSGPTQLSPLK